MSTAPAPAPPRLVALDQFRGYTVLGMFLVNFVGGFKEIPGWLKHHHTYCSYADTIMPQFLFAVGFAYRLTFLRRVEKHGERSAYFHAIRRGLALLLIGVIVHHIGTGVDSWAKLTTWDDLSRALTVGFKRSVFQALTHIGVTSLWVLPVIGLGVWPRVLYALGSGVAHVILSFWFNYVWVNTPPNGIDGGPLGFLTWTIPLITGSLACDAFLGKNDATTTNTNPPLGKLLAASVILMALGYGMSCLPDPRASDGGPGRRAEARLVEPPFVPPTEPVNIWAMSQRSGSITYLTFSAGFSLLVLLLFWVLCDRLGFQWSVFGTLGQNALLGYIIHDMAGEVMKGWVPKDSPEWYVYSALLVFLFICWLCLRHLERHRLFLRL